MIRKSAVAFALACVLAPTVSAESSWTSWRNSPHAKMIPFKSEEAFRRYLAERAKRVSDIAMDVSEVLTRFADAFIRTMAQPNASALYKLILGESIRNPEVAAMEAAEVDTVAVGRARSE